MSIKVMYIIIIIYNIFASYASLSMGSLFSKPVKWKIFMFSIYLLIACCVISTIIYSWKHIFGLLVTYFISIWISQLIFKKTIFKNFNY
jgi:hypothetical protein